MRPAFLFRLALLALALGSLAGCRSSRYFFDAPAAYFRYSSQTVPAVSAHRGGGSYPGYPENCTESFRMLAKRMPVVIECDIRLTRDSVLVLMHDETLDRTSTGAGPVQAQDWQALRSLRLEDHEGQATRYGIPTLEEALRWGRGKVAFTLDVKRGVPYERVVELVQRTGSQGNAAIITYQADAAALVHRLDPSLMISVTVRNEAEYERHRALGVPDSVMVAFVGTRAPDPAFCRQLHSKGIRCILGTLGNLDQMAEAQGDHLYREWVQAGADLLSSDRPLEAWRALQAPE
ncbi:MAG: glycerophosphodiester phosphodiesterase family protein [Bacteroidia bacterium]|nr:glycerophosphodiester phosphodiesterase family protein [Bacteroidia bacterium]